MQVGVPAGIFAISSLTIIRYMSRLTKCLLLLWIAATLLTAGCGVLKKNDCGCPPVPSSGKLRH